MLIDGLRLNAGTSIENAKVSSGNIFPTVPYKGLMFFLDVNLSTHDKGLYVYDGVNWITGDITDVSAGTGLTGGGSVGDVALAIDTTVVASQTDLSSTTSNLQANINAEAITRTTDDTTLQTNINNEISTRLNADNLLQSDINTEVTNRTSADTTLQTNIDNETSNRIAAVTSHTTDVSVHLTPVQNTLLDGILPTITSAEINQLDGTIDNVQGQIDAKANFADMNSHIVNANVHLTASQNTLLDGIAPTVSSTEINYLDGVTSSIQGQIDTQTAASLSNVATHAADNTLHLTASQNTLLDGIAPTVSSTEINYLDGVTTGIQGQIDTLTTADAAHIANTNLHMTAAQNIFLDGLLPGLSSAEVNYLDGSVSNIQVQLDSKLSKAGGSMTGALTLSSDPTQASHAATKSYVDAIASTLDLKDSVAVATTSNITLTGAQTIDGIALSAGMRVLVKDQTIQTENGIYDVSATAWTRSTDADNTPLNEVTTGMYTFIDQGVVNASSGWVLTTVGAITLGTSNLTFTQFSGAGQITAGTGISKTGNTLSVNTVSPGRIVVNADSIDLAASGISPGIYKSVGVDSYGRVTTGSNPTTLAGYGINDATPNTHIGSGGTSHSTATVSLAGFMSSADKSKLDGINLSQYVPKTGNSTISGTLTSTGLRSNGSVILETNDQALFGRDTSGSLSLIARTDILDRVSIGNDTNSTILRGAALDYYDGSTLETVLTTKSSVDATTLSGLSTADFAKKHNESASVVDNHWYTIAKNGNIAPSSDGSLNNGGDRASAMFVLKDVTSSQHQTVSFFVGTFYGSNNNSSISMINNAYAGNETFTKIRLLQGSTYGGTFLQVYVTGYINTTNSNVECILLDNYQVAGWTPTPWEQMDVIPVNYVSDEITIKDQIAAFGNKDGKSVKVSRSGNLTVDGTLSAASSMSVAGTLSVGGTDVNTLISNAVTTSNQNHLSSIRYSKIDNPLTHLFKKNKLVDTLSGRMNATRNSEATFTDNYGNIKYKGGNATTNLCLYSENFENAGWLKTGSVITSNVSISPDQTVTVDKLSENGANTSHVIHQQIPTVVNEIYTFSVFVRKGERSIVWLGISGIANASAWFDIEKGDFLTVKSDVIQTNSLYMGNGIYRIGITFEATSTINYPQIALALTDNSIIYTGNNFGGLYIWGSQFEKSHGMGGYLRTFSTSSNSISDVGIEPLREEKDGWLVEGASTNLCLHSEDFSNVAWSKISGVTITPNSITAPDGNLTASTIDFAAIGDKFCVQHINYAIGSINTITASLYVKAGTSSGIQLRTILFGTQMQDISSVFDAITGAWVTVGIGHTVTVKKLSGGWYRISATTIDNGTGSPSIEIRVQGNNLTGNYYIWGAQVEALPFATSYIPTTTAAVTRAADIVSITDIAKDTSDINNGFSLLVTLSDMRFSADFDGVVRLEHSNIFQHILVSNSALDLYSGLVLNDLSSTFSKYTSLSSLPKTGVYSTTVNSGTQTSYVDGIVDVAGVATDNGLGFYTDIPTTIVISKNHTSFFHIKDFRLYDFALNSDEIKFIS